MTLALKNPSLPVSLSCLSALKEDYPFIICDVWGVIHNGVSAHKDAVNALKAYRKSGGKVILLTNAPLPASMVVQRLEGLGVDWRDICEEIVTSGSLVQHVLNERPLNVFPWGPEKDLVLYKNTLATCVDSLEKADLIVCTGTKGCDLRGETTLNSEVDLLNHALSLGLPFICANPDLSVLVGNQEAICAGKLALMYEQQGGSVQWFGKPYKAVYETCLNKFMAFNNGVRPDISQILAIGDGLGTDMKGAYEMNMASLLITTGLHSHWYGSTPENPVAERVLDRANEQNLSISYFMPWLV